MIFFFDFGNTRWKAGRKTLSGAMETQFGTYEDLPAFIKKSIPKNTEIGVCSVKPSILEILSKANIPMHIVSAQLPITGITSEYQTQNTLGNDRWCNVAAAKKLSPSSSFAIVDIGTCIKYELIENNVYKGGAISPGINLRFQSMNVGAELLPKLQPSTQWNATGNSSTTAMQAGVQFGILAEINTWLDVQKNHNPSLNIFLTGGDAPLFEMGLKNSFFAVPELTLIGIDALLDNT